MPAPGDRRLTLARLMLDELERDPDALEALRQLLGKTDDDKGLLTSWEASDRLGLHPKTLTRAAREGRMPGAVMVAGRSRFKPDQLDLLPPGRTYAEAPDSVAPADVERSRTQRRRSALTSRRGRTRGA